MPALAIVGAQWGDEGKGKIVDVFTPHADIIARAQGGNNAGHTVVINGEKIILHHLPSGILHPKKKCVIGNGVVLDPGILLGEIDALKERGYFQDDSDLLISDAANVNMPYHRAIDLAREVKLGSRKIGTTGRGIGPTYEDKVGRNGIRFKDFLDREVFEDKFEAVIDEKNAYLKDMLGAEPLDKSAIFNKCLEYAERLAKYRCNTTYFINSALDRGKKVLFEGAQGTLLDIDHGTYPFVTSSNTVASGICTGAGIGPLRLDAVLGITKAYTTRVGSGPFPTELDDEDGDYLRRQGAEFGSTTGRPRRCGWMDAVALRYACMVNSMSALAITKLDVLRGLKKIKICTSYEIDGKKTDEFDPELEVLAMAKPVYEEHDGWDEDTSKARTMDDLPDKARRYLKRIEELTGLPITAVSVGPSRDEVILLKRPFELGN